MQQRHNNKTTSLQQSRKTLFKEIYKTLVYSDIFDYPLTADQIFQYLGVKISGKKLLSLLGQFPYVIVKNKIYYFLPKRKNIIRKRIHREKISRTKVAKATTIARFLGFLPTIRFIGISGSVAMLNAEKNGDTDLFFISSAGSVWLTRFIVYVLLFSLGVLRRNKKRISESLCVNMFIDERSLSFTPSKRNVYIAHEIVQIRPLVNKGRIYDQFLYDNKWIKNYFPNFLLPKNVKRKKSLSFMSTVSLLLFPAEYLIRQLQLWYMKQKKTCEVTTPTVIAFHPINYEYIILKAFEQRKTKYGI